MPDTKSKLDKLAGLLAGYGSCAVAFSGGVDSTFLLAAARKELGNRVTAITVDTPYMAKWEIAEAKELCRELDVTHEVITLPIPEDVRNNPEDRCYLCKRRVFRTLQEKTDELGLSVLVDGTNADDIGEYRPGLKALRELKVRSPLMEAGMTKDEIRTTARSWDLSVWDKPPYACLMTRLPHGVQVNEKSLRMVEQAELFFMQHGLRHVRVRFHDEIARVEVPKELFSTVCDAQFSNKAVTKLKELGFKYVCLDLGGYVTGSMGTAGGSVDETA
ncbi:MAG: ATP-dependent sacrificial sulfur transferase LarE [Bacteroidetes bacterium]|nr:ATP-dependent sacrificial sulfur transferase LarE [Bacteroidota bacterium]